MERILRKNLFWQKQIGTEPECFFNIFFICTLRANNDARIFHEGSFAYFFQAFFAARPGYMQFEKNKVGNFFCAIVKMRNKFAAVVKGNELCRNMRAL